MNKEVTAKTSGIFSIIAAIITTLIIFLSSKEYGVASLLVPLFLLVLGLWLLLSKTKGDTK